MKIDILKKSLKSKYWNLIFNKFFKIDTKKLLEPKIILENFSNLNFDINIIYKYALNNKHTKWIKGQDPYQSNHDLQDLNDFSEIRIFIEEFLNEKIKPIFLKDKTIGKFKINSMWFVIMRENTSHTMHAHPKSVLSGVIYLKVQESNSENALKILIPKFNSDKYNNLLEYKEFISQDTELVDYGKKDLVQKKIYEFLPKVKDVIVFNSYMYHWIDQHNQKEERISLAWDAIYTI